MILQSLSDYINANAPMTNIPELLGLHHSNPLGLHPMVIPLLLLLLAIGMHITTHLIHYKERRSLYPLLYALAGVAVVATYYYCFSGDLPLFEDYQLRREEICIGWFCQRSIVGIGWSILGVVLLTYTVFYFKTGLMQLLANICDNMGMEEKQWREWQFFFFVMLLGASIAGLVDEFAPIAGVWIMIAYLVLIGLLTLIKFIVDIVRTHKVFRCLFAALCFLVGIGAVTMLVIECIEGYIYFFIPIICAFATVSFRYKKRQEVAQ